ncbi:hypothetical protein HK097_004303, partial [Rhizophlyctis rosea]
ERPIYPTGKTIHDPGARHRQPSHKQLQGHAHLRSKGIQPPTFTYHPRPPTHRPPNSVPSVEDFKRSLRSGALDANVLWSRPFSVDRSRVRPIPRPPPNPPVGYYPPRAASAPAAEDE